MRLAFAGFRHGHIFDVLKWLDTVEDVQIAAAWETDAAACALADEKGIRITDSDYDRMLLRDDIDFVAIGDYYAARGEKAIAALRAGKSVFTDKPVCTSLDELEEIERLVNEKGLSVGCILDLRHTAMAASAKKAAQRLGEIHNISFGGQHPLNYGTRASWYFEQGKHGGTINDIAIHGIDLVRYITGKGLCRVDAARCWNAYASHEPHFCDSAQLMCELDGAAGLIADVSYAMPYPLGFHTKQSWRFTMWGENGISEFSTLKPYAELTLKGADCVERVEAQPLTPNPLFDFVSELRGEAQELNTREVLRSARDTLTIQHVADISAK